MCMLSFDEVEIVLNDVADELPECFFAELNGGIILLPDIKMHPQSEKPRELMIVGEYHYDRYGLGRYINIYYGSFIKVYRHLSPEEQKAELRRILIHEFTHHMESLAGERGLEIKDKMRLEKYRNSLPRFENNSSHP